MFVAAAVVVVVDVVVVVVVVDVVVIVDVVVVVAVIAVVVVAVGVVIVIVVAVIVVFSTADATSTLLALPQFILEDVAARGAVTHCKIVCTQPRRLAAIGVATRVADERVDDLGKSVGYQVCNG